MNTSRTTSIKRHVFLVMPRALSFLAYATALLILVGCAGRKVSTAAEDQSMVTPLPSKQVAESPTPAPSKSEEAKVEAEPITPPSAGAPPSATPHEEAPAPQEEAKVEAEPIAPPSAAPTPQEVAKAEPAPPAVSPSLGEPPSPFVSDVFFDYDRAVIRSDAVPILEENGRWLKMNNRRSLTIAGHCDERGTLEYNLVLGEKRARAVKQYLHDLGVPAEQIRIVSYGKEKPFCQGHNMECWQQNRRAHFDLSP